MSFVNRSERLVSLKTTEDNKLGPGQYYNDYPLSMCINQAYAPFNIQEQRNNTNRLQYTPGPGSYENKSSLLHKSFNQYLNPNNNQLESHDIKFNHSLFGERNRYKENENNPGPGAYDYFIKPYKEKRTTSKLNNIIKSPFRIVSIPTKDNPYGYRISKDGIMQMAKEAPTLTMFANNYDHPMSKSLSLSKKHQAKIKNPDTYDTNLEKSLSNSIVITTTNNTRNNTLTNTHKDKLLPKKERNVIFNLRKKANLAPKEESFEAIFSCSPGPGYYSIETEDYAKRNLLKLSHFGAYEERDKYHNRQKRNIIGPGEYNIMNDIIKQCSSNPIKKCFKSKRQNYTGQKLKQLLLERDIESHRIGPGYYDPHQDQRNTKSKVSLLNSNQERFIDKFNDNPGPGTYDISFVLNKQNKDIIHKQIIKEFPKLIKNSFPGVGSYYPEIVKSIEYVNQTKLRTNNIPFNNKEKRTISIKNNNSLLGPGSYNPYRHLIKDSTNKHPPFYISLSKEIEQINPTIGPGYYDSSSYHDWIKKSYNILFV